MKKNAIYKYMYQHNNPLLIPLEITQFDDKNERLNMFSQSKAQG